MIVGTFLPEIEIWNLDSENCDPIAVLGDLDASEQSKKLIKNFKKGSVQPAAHPENTHTDAVMSISLNPFQREYLLSGSADQTVRVWDFAKLKEKAQ